MKCDNCKNEFEGEPHVIFVKAKSLILLREDDMVYLMSKSTTSKESDLITND